MTGASLRDLMERMGHDSMRAALIYQHATKTGDAKIAEGIEDLIGDRPEQPPDDDASEPDERR
jgi:hypothetical protein